MDSFLFQLYRGIGALIGLLPLRVGIVLGRLLGWLGYWLAWKYRVMVLRNVEIAFPTKSPHLRRRLARAHFATLIGNLFAMEKIARMPPANVTTLVEVDGLEIVMRLAEERRGFVFLIGHIGNWELLAQMAPMLFPVPSGTIYQRLGSARMDAHVRQVRARAGLSLFERKEGFNAAADMIRKGGCVGVLVDQHAGDGGVWCPLFGRLASTSPLAATLAARANAAILSIAMHTHGIGRWRMVIRGPHDIVARDAREATAQLNVVLEEMIRREPRDWFWVHNRWKTPRPKFLLAAYKRGIVAPPLPSERELDEAESGELFAFAARKQSLGLDGRLQPFRILIRSSNWLGDAVMTVPAVRAIKHGRPDAHVTVLTPAKLADVWKLVPEVDSVIAFEAPAGRGWRRSLAGILHVFKVAYLVRSRGFEAAVLFPNSIRVAIEAWLAGIPRRVGYPGHKGRGIFLNQILREKRRKRDEPVHHEHQMNHYLRLAEFIGAVPSASDLAISSAAQPGTSRIAVCPGAEYGPAKRWLPKRYAEVIKNISAWRQCTWTIVGTAKDRPVAEEIVVEAGSLPNVENLCGRTTLAELIAILRSCDVLLTNDTGTMHLAALMGVRTVAIFGSTEPELTGPLGSGHIVLRKQVECSPCFLRDCPIDFRCMKAIESSEVSAALRAILR
jgi:heptosyltransferase II